MKTAYKSRKSRMGRLSLLLIAVVLVAVVLLNIMVTALAARFSWFTNMGRTSSYTLSDDCRETLSGVISGANAKRAGEGKEPLSLTILFCKDADALEADTYLRYVYRMALEIEEAFPETVAVKYTDTIRNPTAVKKYRGEEGEIRIPDYSVIIDAGEAWSVLSQTDFYELSSEDYASTKGFSGNSRFATTIASLASGESKLACLTTSHGEVFGDYEVRHILTDAGYRVSTIDLRTEEIPEKCSLLLTYAPETDLLDKTAISDVSEITKIGEFLARGGNYMVFLSPDTPELPGLEALLSDWGVVSDRHTVTSVSGTVETYRYMIRNEGASLTAGGYTVSAVRPASAASERIFGTLGKKVRVPFKDATSFSPADGWSVTENGASWSNGTKVASALFAADNGTEAFAAGKRVASGRAFPLLTFTEDSASGGTVTVCGNLEMLSGDFLQSPVLGNRQALLCLMNEYDPGVVLGINYATWPSSKIETITTAEMRNLTVILALTPAILISLAACFVLIRRKREV